MNRKLKDKVLQLSGCGLAPYEIARELECQTTYVKNTINRHKLKMRKRAAEIAFLKEANKIMEGLR